MENDSLPTRNDPSLILETAARTIRERGLSYGHHVGNFRNIRDIFNAVSAHSYLDTVADVAILNIAQKLSRWKMSPHNDDHIIDLLAYVSMIPSLMEFDDYTFEEERRKVEAD
jgi:hypothetical protein